MKSRDIVSLAREWVFIFKHVHCVNKFYCCIKSGQGVDHIVGHGYVVRILTLPLLSPSLSDLTRSIREARLADLLLLNDKICRFGRRQSVDSGKNKE